MESFFSLTNVGFSYSHLYLYYQRTQKCLIVLENRAFGIEHHYFNGISNKESRSFNISVYLIVYSRKFKGSIKIIDYKEK